MVQCVLEWVACGYMSIFIKLEGAGMNREREDEDKMGKEGSSLMG